MAGTDRRIHARLPMRTRAALLATNLLAALIYLYATGVIPPVAGRTAPPMLLVAHRGDVAAYPENTLPAFRSAADQGADGIEMDVWRSRSGTWWVMHDASVDRTTNGTGRIAELTDAQLASLLIDGGIGYERGRDASHTPIPRLSDVLDELNGYSGLLYVHLKEATADAAESLASAIRQRSVSRRAAMIVGSTQLAAVAKEIDPRIHTVVLQDGLGRPPDRPEVDAWLTSERRILRADIVSASPYDVEVYAPGTTAGQDESGALSRAHRFNVHAFLTNDLRSAMEIIRSWLPAPDLRTGPERATAASREQRSPVHPWRSATVTTRPAR